MIIGHGDIAKVLNDRDGFIFFASGVSNSSETSESEFEREEHLLSRFYGSGFLLVYFSSISIFLKQSPYTEHKQLMESLVRHHFENYNIIRLGNIDWGSNPNTFINYIKNRQRLGYPVEIRDELKYMISKEQFLTVTDNLPRFGKHEISVFGEIKRVQDCL